MNLNPHVFDKRLCKQELDEFGNLLQTVPELAEAKDVLPFFCRVSSCRRS